MCKSTSFRQPEKLCGKHKIPIEITYESTDEGYYAVRIELIDKHSYDRDQSVRIEIQITPKYKKSSESCCTTIMSKKG